MDLLRPPLVARPPLVTRLRQEHWVAVDYGCTALLALGYLVAFGDLANLDGTPRWADAVIVGLAVLPAALRRRWPRAVLAVTAVAGAAATALSASPAPPLAVAFVMYLIPLRFPVREAIRLLAVTLLVTAAGLVGFGAAPHGVHGRGGVPAAAGLLLEGGVAIVAAWMIGYAVRQQRAYAAGLREQARQRAREQVAQERRASSEERLRIARELHDVLAHSMSLIAVQAGVANYVVGTHPEEASRALRSIEQTSRSALHELRALLGVLRTEANEANGANGANGAPPSQPDAADFVPTPGLVNLRSLAEGTAQAGVRVDIEVCGERPEVPAGMDLAAYRVVQEALTNVIKHAATDACRVTVGYSPAALTLEITDDGTGTGIESGSGADAGHGIAGMRERVGMYGGHLQAGPLPERGYRVAAQFPLTGSAGNAESAGSAG